MKSIIYNSNGGQYLLFELFVTCIARMTLSGSAEGHAPSAWKGEGSTTRYASNGQGKAGESWAYHVTQAHAHIPTLEGGLPCGAPEWY